MNEKLVECGAISPHDGLRINSICVRPKGHCKDNGLGDYHGTEQDIFESEGGYFWHDREIKGERNA